VLIIASIVTILDLAMNAYLHSLYSVLGIFIPLITTNCIVLARAEAFSSKHSIQEAGLDGLIMGVGLTWVLALLGGLREIIGSGSLFAGANQIFGNTIGNAMVLHIPNYKGFILAILPPGAFIGLGCLLALRTWWEQKSTPTHP
jgi:Na+-translocating ferredoxin:NAD+ oxidoreductase subunit E